MEEFVGSLLSDGLNRGCVCERGSGATPQEPFPEVETTTAGVACSPNIHLVGFSRVLGLGWRKKEVYLVVSGLHCPERCTEGEPICNRGYPEITRQIQCLCNAGDLYTIASKS